jgi:hypothetical protein
MLAYKRPTELTVSAIAITLNSVRWMNIADEIINLSNGRESLPMA